MKKYVGASIPRVDAYAKVTGKAKYAADYSAKNLVYGVPIGSTIAKGTVSKIDTSRAEKMPGVVGILTRTNTPRLHRTSNNFGSWTKLGEPRVLFEDDRVHYYGQYVALVLADSLERGIEAASKVDIQYHEEKPLVFMQAAMNTAYPAPSGMGPATVKRGDIDAALAGAKFRVSSIYTAPVEHHNPMEPCAVMASWEGERLTQYDSTQWVMGARNCVADMLAVSRDNVHIVSHYVGGGFGCKGFIWPHQAMAAVAAKKLQRPTRVALSRQAMFTACGHRPETQQQVELAADATGKLLGIRHTCHSQTSPLDDYVERSGAATPMLYDVPAVDVSHKLIRVNIQTPTPMRGPGECTGTFALESAVDELAWQMGLDPIELRMRNYAEIDREKGVPFSGKHLRECYEMGRDSFGWKKRIGKTRSQRFGNNLVGYGMATATYPAHRSAGAATVRLTADGTAMVSSATQDIGTGTYTTMRQVAADVLEVDFSRVRSELGDSQLPPAPVSGGSMTTASVTPAVEAACKDALQKIAEAAVNDANSPFHKANPKDIEFRGGSVWRKGAGGAGLPYADVLKSARIGQVQGEAKVQQGEEEKKFSFHSFGAHFVEVHVDEDFGIVRVPRALAVFDIGTVINLKTARSQALGGVAWGIGMALMEHTVYDGRNGKPVTDNLGDYLVPVNADVRQVDVQFINKPDENIGGLGARGVGEIGITGVGAAIANAVYHATGIRVRNLPITPEKLMNSAARLKQA